MSTPLASRPATSRPPTQAARDRIATQTEKLLRAADGCPEPRRGELLDEVIVLNTPMARTLASRYDGRGVEGDDLTQVAFLGLIKAAHRYRPAPGTDFRSYAIPTIRGELKRHFRDNAWTVRPPRRVQDAQATINTAEGRFVARRHRWPTPAELAAESGLPLDDVMDAQSAQSCFQPLSLDAPVTGGATTQLGSFVADPSEPYELIDQVESLRPALQGLSARDRLILRRRFIEYRTQAEIATEIGVSQMQVSRLLSRILSQLRTTLDAA
ncbi:sigma-70 family RNA polymerase sigma factor [Kribbella deserti]|uniref:Sigma-70 family RNA polymerase sigma factor n=1 Tax=Kribbella deserti TaxID=1926257 RepID=A0ABV6QS75_9ACTN